MQEPLRPKIYHNIKNMNKEKNSKCPVCGEPMNLFVPFCPRCSFEVHNLPDGTPENIRKMEEERVRVAKNAYAQHAAAANENASLADSNKRLTEEISRLDKEKKELQNRTVHIKDLAAKNDKEIAVLTIPASEVKKELDDAKKKITEMSDKLNSLEEKVELRKSGLAKKEEEYKNPTKPLTEERPEKTRDKKRTGQVIGTVTFNLAGQIEAIPIYSGLNRVSAPQWANISGDLFDIDGENGIYRLHDLKGCICDRHGKQIPPQGATTRNNEVFMVDNMTIRFTLPEIDLDYLY